MIAGLSLRFAVLSAWASVVAFGIPSVAAGAEHTVRVADATAFSSIVAALDAASDGDTIRVYPGVYPEPLTIDKPIVLVSVVPHAAVIDGGGAGDVIRIEAPDVEISGFEVRNAGTWGSQPRDSVRFVLTGSGGPQSYASIRCAAEGAGATIRGNLIRTSIVGILVQGASSCAVTDNIVEETIDAIRLDDCLNVTVESNTVRSNSGHGVRLQGCVSCSLTGNGVAANLDAGIALAEDTSECVVASNIVTSGGAGILVEGSLNAVASNVVEENSIGIGLGATSSDNTISGNRVSRSRAIGIDVEGARNSVEAGNRITSNALGIRVGGTDTVVTGNTIRENLGDGVRVDSGATGASVVANPEIASNGGGGIRLLRSVGVTLADNVLSADGIRVEGEDPSHWDSHSISGNLAGESAIRYFANQAGVVVPADTSQLILAGCTDTVLDVLSFDEVDVGIAMAFCSGITVDGCSMSRCVEGALVQDSSAVVFRAVTVDDAVGHGYRVERSSDVRFEGGQVRGNGKGGLRFDAVSDLSMHQVLVEDNGGDGIRVEGTSDGATITDCTVLGNGGIGIHVDSESTGLTVTGNTVAANDDGVLLKLIHGGAVSDNLIEANRLYGLKLTFVESLSIERNVIRDNTFYFGIRLCGQSCYVADNTLTHNGSGILVCGDGNQVGNNVITAHLLDGMRVRYDVEGNTIEGNLLRGNQGYGIALEGSSNRIDRNEIRGNGSDGIHALERVETGDRPCRNEITSNLVVGNGGFGLRLDAGSERNRIFGNSFGLVQDRVGVVHRPRVRDDGQNRWDGGALAGGNFWADYEGADSDGDGFGDVSYVVPGAGGGGGMQGRIDRFPRMVSPWGL